MGSWEDIKEHLEPVNKNYYLHDPATDIQLSQAISLKRIADALEKLTKPIVMPELTPEQLKDLESEWQKANKIAGFMEYKR